MAQGYYETLGVARDASSAEIKRAYRRMARKHHPDVNPGDAEAEARFKEIQEAYAVLSDPERKRQYDTFGRVDGTEGGGDPFGGRSRGAGRWQESPGFKVEFGDFAGGFGDLGDLFGQFFGGARPRRDVGARAQAGGDQELGVEIDFVDSVRGASVTLPVQRKVACAACSGEGVTAGSVCRSCKGAGVVIQTERLRVRIPEGIADGARVRVQGKGSEGRGGGRAGDLFVRVRVRAHPFFVRDGDDIRSTVPITFTEGYRGAEIEVGTVHGPVRAKIPPGTSSGRTLRLRGKGVRNTRTRAFGDHLCTVEIVVPKVVSPVGQEIARQVTELYHEDVRAGLPRGL